MSRDADRAVGVGTAIALLAFGIAHSFYRYIRWQVDRSVVK